MCLHGCASCPSSPASSGAICTRPLASQTCSVRALYERHAEICACCAVDALAVRFGAVGAAEEETGIPSGNSIELSIGELLVGDVALCFLEAERQPRLFGERADGCCKEGLLIGLVALVGASELLQLCAQRLIVSEQLLELRDVVLCHGRSPQNATCCVHFPIDYTEYVRGPSRKTASCSSAYHKAMG